MDEREAQCRIGGDDGGSLDAGLSQSGASTAARTVSDVLRQPVSAPSRDTTFLSDPAEFLSHPAAIIVFVFDSLPGHVGGPFVIGELAALDPQHLSAAARVDALVAWERHIAWRRPSSCGSWPRWPRAGPVRGPDSIASGFVRTSPARCACRRERRPIAWSWPSNSPTGCLTPSPCSNAARPPFITPGTSPNRRVRWMRSRQAQWNHKCWPAPRTEPGSDQTLGAPSRAGG